VPLAAVGLEDHALLPPDEVDPDRRPAIREHQKLVGFRVGNPEGPRDRQEKLLVLAPGGGRADVVLGQDLPNRLGAGPRRVAGELVVDGAEVERLEDLGLVEGPFELAVGDDFCQVEERAGDGRDRDVVDRGYVGWRERGRAVNLDAIVLSLGATGHGDLDLRVAPVTQPMERRPGAVRKRRPRTTRHNGRHVKPLTPQQLPRAERVDGVVDPVQAAGRRSVVHGPGREAELS
jgi:hypothetical protein